MKTMNCRKKGKMIRTLRFVLVLCGFVLLGEVVHAQISKPYDHRYDPPWDNVVQEGTPFTIYGIDNAPDFHGDINNPDLVVFFAGNQYMAVPELLEAFKTEYPQYKRIFAETIPPGIEERQVKSGILVVGNMRIQLKPDVITAGKGSIEKNEALGWFSRTKAYAKNRLAIMVGKGNPKNIKSLQDLGRSDMKVSMPNPEWEGIGRRITKAYENVGGEALKTKIMKEKVGDGTTYLTTIHHRQTPMSIMYKESDAGPVWYSEAFYHSQLTDHPLKMVTIPNNVNVGATYVAGQMKNAEHPEAAKAFIEFLTSDKGQAIYKKYGFITVR
ncbi:substrate-binding domain-containing protein [Maribacter sp. MMG018]|nr:substrate-binding domain-containing protein [Maribacter sp. MMG018]